MTNQNDYPGLDRVRIASKEGDKDVMTFALTVFLLTRGRGTIADRQAHLDALVLYQNDVGSAVTHYQKAMAKRLSLIPTDGVADVYKEEIDRLDLFYDDWGGNVQTKDPLHQYGATCIVKGGQGIVRRPLGYFRAYYPCAYAKTHTDHLIANVIAWCNILKPEQGQIGLTPHFEWGMARSYPDVYWPFIKRFNGLEFTTAFGVAAKAERGLKSVSWLTVLDDAYVADLGGLAALTPLLGPNAIVHPWDGGIVIQAGAEPQIGDTNAGVWPEDYIAVNNALRPIRFEAYRNSPMSLIKVPPPLDAFEETLKWVRRFDREP